MARNCHRSTINAIKAFGLDFRFLPSPYDPEFEAVLPPSVDQVVAALKRYPEALAVVYTSPTYEGLCANTHAIAAAVHDASDHAVLFVDEAWGGHLHFHPDLPPSAIDASRCRRTRSGRSTTARRHARRSSQRRALKGARPGGVWNLRRDIHASESTPSRSGRARPLNAAVDVVAKARRSRR